MIKTNFIMKSNRMMRVTVRVMVKFILFWTCLHWQVMQHAPDFTWTEKVWGGNVRWTTSYEKEQIILWSFNWKFFHYLSLSLSILHYPLFLPLSYGESLMRISHENPSSLVLFYQEPAQVKYGAIGMVHITREVT